MSYQEALRAAGANVIAYETFGSYQGDWWAAVRTPDGVRFIHGYYGSCSGCDAFEAEFDYGEEECEDHRWGQGDEATIATCDACKSAKAVYEQKLRLFGAHYLTGLMTAEEAEQQVRDGMFGDAPESDEIDQLRFIEARK